jgi:hypothetical protein
LKVSTALILPNLLVYGLIHGLINVQGIFCWGQSSAYGVIFIPRDGPFEFTYCILSDTYFAEFCEQPRPPRADEVEPMPLQWVCVELGYCQGRCQAVEAYVNIRQKTARLVQNSPTPAVSGRAGHLQHRGRPRQFNLMTAESQRRFGRYNFRRQPRSAWTAAKEC